MRRQDVILVLLFGLSGCAQTQPAIKWRPAADYQLEITNDPSVVNLGHAPCRVEWQATEQGWWCRPVPPESLVDDGNGERWVRLHEGAPFYRVVPWHHGGIGCGCP